MRLRTLIIGFILFIGFVLPSVSLVAEISQGPDGAPQKSNPDKGPEGRIFHVEIKNRKVPKELNVVRVKQGDQVTLKWTTDETTTVHLHGYNIKKEIKPGEATLFTFKAHATGRFPITSHGFGEQANNKDKQAHEAHRQEAPLLYLEVLP